MLLPRYNTSTFALKKPGSRNGCRSIQNLLQFYVRPRPTYCKNKTRCTQREQNARLHVTSLSSDIKYCKEDNKIK